MPKLPDDMSDDAVAKRAKLSLETRAISKAVVEPPSEAELAAFRKKYDLPDDAVVFMCRRGRT
jgi:hypothetical protein